MDATLMRTILASLLLPVMVSATDLLRVCYYSNWSQYRPGSGKFFPTDIDPDLCTHLIYSFAKLDTKYELATYEWNDDTLYGQFNALRVGRNLKTLIAVGGWNAGSTPFSTMVADPALRAKFVRTSVTFVQSKGFDGLDLDWEYPGKRGGDPNNDIVNFVKLCQELRVAFDAQDPPLLLTAAVPAGQSNIDTGYDIPALDSALDFINLMSYDLHGAWDPVTGFNSPLYARSDETSEEAKLNMKWAAEYWVKKGATKEKLIIGLATYGRSFTLANANSYHPGADATRAGTAGQYTREAGFLAYYEVCTKLSSGAGTRYWEAEHKVPYYVEGDLWVGYDDEQSFTEKVNWIIDEEYGGVMFWNIDLDDFNKQCTLSTRRYPLMSLAKDILDGNAPPTNPPTTGPPTNPPTTGPSTNPPSGSTQPPTGSTQPPTGSTQPPTGSTQPPTGSTTKSSTNPPATGFCQGKSNGYYDDPNACDKFYLCSQDCTYHFDCPSGLHWNQAKQQCDWPANVNCQTSTTESPVTPDPDDDDEYCVGKPDGYYEDDDDCTMYFRCWTECAYHMSCPDGLYWNQEEEECDNPENVNCSSASTTMSQTASTTVSQTASTTVSQTASTTVSQTASTTTSAPGREFCKGKPDGIYKNPDDCSTYYNCHADRTFEYPCTAGYLFDALYKSCREASLVDCSEQDDTSGFCIGKAGVYPYPYDCQRYYNCGSDITYVLKCNPPTLYNDVMKYCDHAENVDCGSRPLP